MLSFTTPAGRFQVRVAAIVMQGSRVLLHRAPADPFWALPGGRLEYGEDAATAVIREIGEELGVSATIHGLRFVVENFFVYRDTSHHELGLYFDVGIDPGAAMVAERGDFAGIEASESLIFRWFELGELGAEIVRPAFLVDALARREAGTVHVVQREVVA